MKRLVQCWRHWRRIRRCVHRCAGRCGPGFRFRGGSGCLLRRGLSDDLAGAGRAHNRAGVQVAPAAAVGGLPLRDLPRGSESRIGGSRARVAGGATVAPGYAAADRWLRLKCRVDRTSAGGNLRGLGRISAKFGAADPAELTRGRSDLVPDPGRGLGHSNNLNEFSSIERDLIFVAARLSELPMKDGTLAILMRAVSPLIFSK